MSILPVCCRYVAVVSSFKFSKASVHDTKTKTITYGFPRSEQAIDWIDQKLLFGKLIKVGAPSKLIKSIIDQYVQICILHNL